MNMPGISILNNWNYLGKHYDFDRQGFTTIDAMKNFSENYLPPLYIATNEEDGGVYLYNVSNDVDDTTGKWRPLSGSGSSADLLNYYNKTQTNALLDDKANADDVYAKTETYTQDEVDDLLDNKANVGDSYTKAEDDALLNLKMDKTSAYTKQEIDDALDLKADKTSVYTITQTDTLLALKADKSDVYTKTQTDALLDDKADKSTTYTKTEVNDLLDDKADKSTTYTKTEVNTLLDGKANVGDSYTKAQDDALLNNKADKSTTYTKTEVDDLLDDKINAADLATVATTGSYTDLTDTPTIDNALSNTSENAVQNKVVTLKFNDIADDITTVDEKVDTKVAQTEYDAKITEIENTLDLLGRSTARVVDEQPVLNEDGTVTYQKDGTEHTDEDDEIWYYYVDSESGHLMQSIVIANTLLTIESAGGIDFDVYLNRNVDVAHTYVGDETGNAALKVADMQALKALETIIDDKLDDKVDTTTYTQGQAEQDTEIAKKANSTDVYTKTEVDDLLDTKSGTDNTYTKNEINTLLYDKANVTDVYTQSILDTWFDQKADKVSTYTKTEADALLGEKAEWANVYSKAEINTLLDAKAGTDNVYTKTQTDALLDDKADKSTTYTKTEVDTAIQTLDDNKANKTDVYTKTQTDTLLDDKVNVDDFTDYQSDVSDALDTKVDKAQGETNANKILGTDDDGNVTLLNPSALGNSAENISYDNASFTDFTNVKLALDGILEKLYYVEPSITSFTMTPATTQYEIGTVVNGVTFAWTVNKDITSQTLTGCTLDDETVRTASYTTDISANKTFTLAVSDGQKSATASKTISFLHKVYWGSATEPSGGYTSAWILALSNSKLASSNKGTYSFNAGSGEYAYFAVPSSMKPSSAWVNGFNTDLEDCGNISFTNASGNTSTFSIVRFMQKSLGSFSAEIK